MGSEIPQQENIYHRVSSKKQPQRQRKFNSFSVSQRRLKAPVINARPQCFSVLRRSLRPGVSRILWNQTDKPTIVRNFMCAAQDAHPLNRASGTKVHVSQLATKRTSREWQVLRCRLALLERTKFIHTRDIINWGDQTLGDSIFPARTPPNQPPSASSPGVASFNLFREAGRVHAPPPPPLHSVWCHETHSLGRNN